MKNGFYGLSSVVAMLARMALLPIKTPEQLAPPLAKVPLRPPTILY